MTLYLTLAIFWQTSLHSVQLFVYKQIMVKLNTDSINQSIRDAGNKNEGYDLPVAY